MRCLNTTQHASTSVGRDGAHSLRRAFLDSIDLSPIPTLMQAIAMSAGMLALAILVIDELAR